MQRSHYIVTINAGENLEHHYCLSERTEALLEQD